MSDLSDNEMELFEKEENKAEINLLSRDPL